MADEVQDGNQEITGDVSERIVAEAMEALHPTTTDQSEVESPTNEVKAEAAETATTETKPETDVKDGEVAEKAPEVVKSEASTTDKKPMYTPEEINRLLADENAKADTSRMTPEVQLYYREMQRGLTQKSQRLADEKRQLLDDIAKREKALRDKEIAEEEKRLRAEEELLDPEHAKDRQEKRSLQREMEDWKRMVQQEKEAKEAEQRRHAAEQVDRDWTSAAPANNIPNDPEFAPSLQDLALSYTWAKNVGAAQQGQPLMSVSDGVKEFANIIGLTNEKNLEKIVNANPKFREAFEKKIIEGYIKKQAAGPTTIRSTSGSVKEMDKSDERPTKEMLDDPDFNYSKKIEDDAMEMLRKIKT
jgi:hypothetical protein